MRLLFISLILAEGMGWTGLQAQPPDTLWSREYVELGRLWPVNIVSTPNSGCVVFGEFSVPNDPHPLDGELVKLTSAGEVQWMRRFGVAGNDEYVLDGIETRDSGFVLAGSGSELDSGQFGMVAVKYGADGDSQWSNPLQIEGSMPWVTAVTETQAGELAFAIQSNSPIIVWLDSVGQFTRLRTYPPHAFAITRVTDLVETANANLVMLVWIDWLDSASAGAIGVNSVGDTLWTRLFSDPPGLSHISFVDGCQLEGDSILIAGFGNQADTPRVALFKLDPRGNLTWSQYYAYGHNVWIGDRANIVEDYDGGFVISASVSIGGSPGCGLLFKVNRAGEMLWYRIFFASDWSHDYSAYGLSIIPGGGYFQALSTLQHLTVVRYTAEGGASAQPSPHLPAHDFGISSIYPNPFNPTTTISFSLPQAGKVKIEVFDVMGRLVAVPQPEAASSTFLSAGEHRVEFDGTGMASGIYFVRMTAGAFVQTRKMVLLK